SQARKFRRQSDEIGADSTSPWRSAVSDCKSAVHSPARLPEAVVAKGILIPRCGVLLMPKMNLAVTVPAMLLLALTPLASSAQERTQEKETKTTEKEKPAEPTPPPPKEESSATEH